MSDIEQDITPELIELGVGIAIGNAGLQMSESATAGMLNSIRALWPEELSADALEVGTQVALAIVAWVNMQEATLVSIAGGDLLVFSQSLLPTTPIESE